MRRRWIVLLLLLVSAVASAQDAAESPEPEQFVTSRAIVPIIGSLPGLNDLQWRTDVTIANPGASDVEIVMVMTGAPGEPFFMTPVPAGGALVLPDIARLTFGAPGVHGSLLVETFGPSSVLVEAVVYGTKPGFNTDPQRIRAIYGDFAAPAQMLSGLSFDEDYRTNIGIANVSDSDATVYLSIQRILGRTLAATTVRVPARSVILVGVNELFPLLTEGRNFYLAAETDSAGTVIYASVISNTTPRASYSAGVLR